MQTTYSRRLSPSNSCTVWCLYYGSSRTALAQVVPDARYPGMWRVKLRDVANLSDVVNLSRAKDAAMVLGMRRAPSNEPALLRWKQEGGERASGARPSRLPAPAARRSA
jgi:hypothetical protein